jgi:hypothetical protein
MKYKQQEKNKMKKMNRVAAVIVLLVGLAAVPAMTMAQDISVGADIVSSYVWRGMDCGDSAAVQPYVEFSSGGFAIGAWGSYTLGSDEDVSEADLYVGYGFENGLYVGLTDYYFPGDGVEYLDTEDHTYEANLGYEAGAFSFSANMYFEDDNNEDDMYFEVGYDFGLASIFLGGGDEAYTEDGDFAICNLGISADKEIEITDTFTLPMFGSVIVNPDSEDMYIVVGMSF